MLRQCGELAGGASLEARCPRHPNIQLLLDQQGVLHLLARHPTEAGSDPSATLAELMQTAAWAREHAALLHLTQRQMAFDRDAEPMLHLFSDRPKDAVALTRQIHPRLKVHLLQAVHVGEAATWVCNALN